MPLYTKTLPIQPNDQATNDKIISLAKKQSAVFDQVLQGIVPGMTTADLADIARKAASEIEIEFSFRKKFSFPEDISVCRNHEIINGIPKHDSLIAEGDLVKLSLGTNESMSAFCTQTWTVLVGAEKTSPEKLRLLSSTKKCLNSAIEICTPGTKVSTIVTALNEVAKIENIVLSDSFVGHLIGKEPIMPPHFVLPKGLVGEDHALSVGTVFSLLALGHSTKPKEKLAEDKWTVVEKERLPSAAFSHMILISANGPQILTSTYED